MTGLFRRFFGRTGETLDERPQRTRLSIDPWAFAAIYAIGDVHGCYDALVEAERRIAADAEAFAGEKLIVLLGDYVDRGKRSRDVLQHLCLPAPAGFQRVALCGNHDDAFLRFLENPQANTDWLKYGGAETLYSYGIDVAYLLGQGRSLDELCSAIRASVPAEHLELLRSMPIVLSVGGLIFVHAGVRPGISLDSQSDRDLMWIREPFITEGPQLPSLVVHGHTPGADPDFGSGRIGIDTAAFATGRLTVLKISGGEPSIMAAAA
jgi:serine/threonine protein phosphatase 1